MQNPYHLVIVSWQYSAIDPTQLSITDEYAPFRGVTLVDGRATDRTTRNGMAFASLPALQRPFFACFSRSVFRWFERRMGGG